MKFIYLSIEWGFFFKRLKPFYLMFILTKFIFIKEANLEINRSKICVDKIKIMFALAYPKIFYHFQSFFFQTVFSSSWESIARLVLCLYSHNIECKIDWITYDNNNVPPHHRHFLPQFQYKCSVLNQVSMVPYIIFRIYIAI